MLIIAITFRAQGYNNRKVKVRRWVATIVGGMLLVKNLLEKTEAAGIDFIAIISDLFMAEHLSTISQHQKPEINYQK